VLKIENAAKVLLIVIVIMAILNANCNAHLMLTMRNVAKNTL